MANVVMTTRVAGYNVDACNRTAVCAQDIDNGCVFKLNKYSETPGESAVWECEQAAANDTGLWMAFSPEIVTIVDPMGVEYRGMSIDPRAFTNVAGRMIDAIHLQEGDVIEMTGDGIENVADMDYLVPAAANFQLEASAAAGQGFTLHKIKTGILHIGGAMIAKSHPTTYFYEVVNN